MNNKLNNTPLLAWMTVLIAGLGYFVDVIDLWLFSNYRVASLKDLGLSEKEITNTGAMLINFQQAGLLLGGLVWGVLGDKRGRASVMFGSITLYSVANILNAYVQNIPQYAALRFITGFGLAGEIGAGITLICEILPKHQRGIGTTIMTTLGVAGAIAAALMGKYLDWRTGYLVGGIMGLGLLILRVITHDSGMFDKMKLDCEVKRGSLRMLFANKERISRFISCVALGAPIYLAFAIFCVFAPEITKTLGTGESAPVAEIFLMASIGLTVGDLLAGSLSQILKKRKLPLALFISANCCVALIISYGIFSDPNNYRFLCGVLGLFSGYWACLITTAAEQFGTNLRATVTTMVPNVVRATAIPLTLSFVALKESFSMQTTLLILTGATFTCAFLGLAYLKETFHRDLDFYEH
jgi:MFS transporter, putative metabolite:H+ symporter